MPDDDELLVVGAEPLHPLVEQHLAAGLVELLAEVLVLRRAELQQVGVGPPHQAADLDVALLFEPGRLALALDVEGLALGFEVASADADDRILLDVVA